MFRNRDSHAPSPKRSWRRWITAVLLVLYWPALLLATHLPSVPMPQVEGSDKVLHSLAYAGLAFLLAHYAAARWSLRPRHFAGLWLTVCLYGAIDEFSQIPFGRSAELLDWVADAAGGAAGTALAVATLTLLPLLRRKGDRMRPIEATIDRR